MIYFSIGMPSAFADWCEAALTVMARRQLGVVELIDANTLDELATNILKTGASNLIVSSRTPNDRLAGALAEAKMPMLFVLDDPHAAIAYLTAERKLDRLAAIRAVANSYACLMRCAKLSKALVLDVSRHGHEPLAAIRLIAKHFGFPAAEPWLAEVLAGIRAKRPESAPRAGDAWWNGLDKPAQALVDGATKGYAEFFSAGRLGLITWHRELFLDGDARKPVTQAIDVTGRARCLTCGPNIRLPPGSWTAQVVFGCSKDAVGISLLLDVFAGTQLSQAQYRPKTGGIFEVSLKFTLEEANDHPIEVRISNEKAALEGRLSLSHVYLALESAPRMVQNPVLSAELGLEVS